MRTQRIIRVSLQASTGERWDAIGGGDSVDAAVDFALQSAPANARWRVVAWRDIFGD